MKLLQILTALSPFLPFINALGQAPVLTTSPPQNSSSPLLPLAGSGFNSQILVSLDDWWGVLRAAEDLATDFGKVTGTNLTLANWNGGGAGGSSKRGVGRRSSVEHNVSMSSGEETTVFYTYNPPTSNINVSYICSGINMRKRRRTDCA